MLFYVNYVIIPQNYIVCCLFLISHGLFCIQIFRIRRKKMATKEEELQKKREEAERKARRGEIDPTHEFTFQVFISVYIFLGAECKNWIINGHHLTFFVNIDCCPAQWTASPWDYGFHVFESDHVGWLGFLIQVWHGTETHVLLSGNFSSVSDSTQTNN